MMVQPCEHWWTFTDAIHIVKFIYVLVKIKFSHVLVMISHIVKFPYSCTKYSITYWQMKFSHVLIITSCTTHFIYSCTKYFIICWLMNWNFGKKKRRREKKEGMTWIQRGLQTLTHSESPLLYKHEARLNEKRLTFVNLRQQSYALSKTPPVCIT